MPSPGCRSCSSADARPPQQGAGAAAAPSWCCRRQLSLPPLHRWPLPAAMAANTSPGTDLCADGCEGGGGLAHQRSFGPQGAGGVPHGLHLHWHPAQDRATHGRALHPRPQAAASAGAGWKASARRLPACWRLQLQLQLRALPPVTASCQTDRKKQREFSSLAAPLNQEPRTRSGNRHAGMHRRPCQGVVAQAPRELGAQ